MNVYKITTPDGIIEKKTKKEITGVIIFTNSHSAGWQVTLTSRKNPEVVLQEMKKWETPNIKNFQLAEFTKAA